MQVIQSARFSASILILSNCSWGFPSPPLTYSFSTVSAYIEQSWLTTTWEFLQDINGLLELANPWMRSLDCRGDTFIMPAAHWVHSLCPSRFLPQSEVIKFNCCRIYHQVLSLSARHGWQFGQTNLSHILEREQMLPSLLVEMAHPGPNSIPTMLDSLA